jgi:hypothetical protein
LVDFKNDVRPEQRFPELIEIVEKNAFPWLDNYCNLEKIKDWILGAQPHGLPVSKAVFQYLGIKKE